MSNKRRSPQPAAPENSPASAQAPLDDVSHETSDAPVEQSDMDQNAPSGDHLFELVEFFEGVAAALDLHPQGAQGSCVLSPPIPLPEGFHEDDGVVRVEGGRWQFLIENNCVVSGTRRDQTHLWRRGARRIQALSVVE